MTDPKRDPARRCMPLAEWPALDQAAWEAAIRGGDLLEEAGPAAHWRPATQSKVVSSYGRFLTFLSRQDRLDPLGSPSDRITPEILRGYIAELEAQVAPVTLAQRLTDLSQALRVMAPGTDPAFLRRAANRRSALARPRRDKQSRMTHPQVLLDLGIRVMADADVAALPDRNRACRFRDGLIVALLATRAIRIGNLCAIRIGRQLTRDVDGYRLVFEGTEMKNHAPQDLSLPDVLTLFMDRYALVYRPILLVDEAHDQLWISYFRRPMGPNGIYDNVRRVTEEGLGVALNPHAFRDCQATFVAIEDPAHVRSVASLLGHRDPATAERFYNQARMVEAAQNYQDTINDIRREAAAQLRRRHRKETD